MHVAEMLVVTKVDKVVRFAADCHLSHLRDFDCVAVSGSLHDGEVEKTADDVGLELV